MLNILDICNVTDTIPGGNVNLIENITSLNPLIFREMKNLVKNDLGKGKMSLYVRQLFATNTTEIHPDTSS